MASAVVLAALALVVKPLRSALVYRSHEYTFPHRSSSERCEWDIQWESQRLTIKAKDVHNNWLEDVHVIYQDEPPGEHFPKMNVSRDFVGHKRWPIRVQLASIVRYKSDTGREYEVSFVIRRRRW